MNTTIEFAEMKAFVAVVSDSSFTTAAERLGTDKARVSRIVRKMEEKLGVRLLNRSTRRLSVTEVGRDYFERAVVILNAAEAAEAAVAQQSGELKGQLRITAGTEFGTMVVDEWVAAFLKFAPKVTMETEYTNRLVDIIHEGIDVAIRVGNLPDSGLSARKLGEISYGLYAAPNYLKNSPILTKVTDLGGHQLIAKTNSGRSSWTLLNGIHSENIEISVRAGVSSILTAKNLALSGIGIAQLPRFLAEPYVKDELLSLVLPGWAHAPVPVNAVFASSRYMDPKVRSFVDLCISSFRDSMVVSVT